ncbi:uncharacterized protein LOC143542656 [Bidens hawaiensis]|uniref:uncharacterized protein LOC143542656 n=1 Tax=Bidens hawaiensis TaxID=980011 RepID=UPI00404B4AA7
MPSPEDHSNTKTEDETTAFQKKRSRRVSFAENTFVHIFHRDDEEQLPNSPLQDLGFAEKDTDSKHFSDDDDDADDEFGPSRPFFRVAASPSSAGSTISATSNDEDNFFGPVSTNFIRRDLLDSAGSDDNYDQTLDSTAFSMHFQSLARSDSFAEKTPTLNSVPSDTRNHMQLTLVNKLDSRPVSAGSPSNDMSLVETYHDKYDYGNLLPVLDPLSAEDQNEKGSDFMDFSYNQDNRRLGVMNHEEHNKDVSVKHNEILVVADNGSKPLLTEASKPPTPNHTNMAHHLNGVTEKENSSPSVGLISHLISTPNHMLLNGVGLFRSPGTVTPSNNQTSFIQRASVSSLQKSMSKLRSLEASPFSTTLIAKLEDSNYRSLVGLSKMTHLGTLLEKEGAPTNMNNDKTITHEGRESSSPLNVAGSNIEEMMHDSDVHNNSGTRGDLTNLSKDIQHDNIQPVLKESDISLGQLNASIVLNGRMDEKTCLKNLADQLNNEKVDSLLAENVRSDVSSAERKRKAEHETTGKIAKIKQCSISDLEVPNASEISNSGPNLEHLAQIHTTFFKETKLLPHSVDKMNLHAIDRMIDILGQLQRSETYQLLSSEYQSKDKRAAEIKLVLCKFVYEQAKLQLMHVKREMLLKNIQSLASGIQEVETLKLNHPLDVRAIHQQPLSDNIMDTQMYRVDNDKVTSLMQESEDINRRISNLTKSLHISCKIKGELNPADTIAFANNHLLKKARCQIIRKDMQLWTIDDLKNSKDHHDVVLNYIDLLSQRIMVTAGPCYSVSNTLNQRNIQKNFKDMDASTAFEFVFDALLLQKHVSANLAHETQVSILTRICKFQSTFF